MNFSDFYSDEANADLPLSPSELSEKTIWPYDFITLVVELGCPTIDGKISANDIINWVVENYDWFCSAEHIRKRSLTAENPAELLAQKKERALLAIVEWCESHTGDPDRKRLLTENRMLFLMLIQPCSCGSGLKFKDCCGKAIFG